MAVGFYVNIDSCIGCRTCQVACKDRHNIQVPGPRLRRVQTFEAGTYPEAGLFTTVISCNHCDNPACTAICPTGAMYKDEATGVVLHDDAPCIQCQSCVNACPYGAPQFIEQDNLIVKCDTCMALREAGKNPTCVDACPMRAIEFGDIDELKAAHPDAVLELPCMPKASQTQPNALIGASEFAKSEAFNPVVM